MGIGPELDWHPSDKSELTPAQAASLLSSRLHVLVMSSKKAKRISQSTSHAESLAAHNCLAHAEMISQRMAEIFCPYRIDTSAMLAIDESDKFDLAIDHYTDCHDLFDLVCGDRGCPQDKTQRLIILSL